MDTWIIQCKQHLKSWERLKNISNPQNLVERTRFLKAAVQIIEDLSYNKPKRFYKINGIIFKVKKNVKKIAVSQLELKRYDALRFHLNTGVS